MREQEIALTYFRKDNQLQKELLRKRKEDHNIATLTRKSAAV